MLFKKFSYILYVIVLFSEIISVTIASASPDCDTLEKALAYLKGDVLQEYSYYSNCCGYPGVACDYGNQISRFKLNDYSSSEADIKSFIEAITDLNGLTSLEIINTSFPHGVVIPDSITKLKYLKKLTLSDNQSEDAESTIPEIIGNLTRLEELTLSNNNYVGAIPKFIKNLKKLQILNLSDNDLSGVVPMEISELDNLKKLYLKNNKKLKGYVPLNSNIEYCDYSDTNLCYLKSNRCKIYKTIPKCEKEDIINTNKENGVDSSTYESEAPSIFENRLIIACGGIFVIILIIGCFCICKFCLCKTTRSGVSVRINNNNINRNNNNINRNYNSAPTNTIVNKNTYNTYNSAHVNNCYPSYSEEAPPPYSENTNASYNNDNKSSDTYPLKRPTFPLTAYTPSA